jgi:hypothetical protein
MGFSSAVIPTNQQKSGVFPCVSPFFWEGGGGVGLMLKTGCSGCTMKKGRSGEIHTDITRLSEAYYSRCSPQSAAVNRGPLGCCPVGYWHLWNARRDTAAQP